LRRRVGIGVQCGTLAATVPRWNSRRLRFGRGKPGGGTMTRLERGITGLVGALSEIAFNVLPALVYLGVAVVVMLPPRVAPLARRPCLHTTACAHRHVGGRRADTPRARPARALDAHLLALQRGALRHRDGEELHDGGGREAAVPARGGQCEP